MLNFNSPHVFRVTFSLKMMVGKKTSLKLTATLHLKINGLENEFTFFGRLPIFRGFHLLLVLGGRAYFSPKVSIIRHHPLRFDGKIHRLLPTVPRCRSGQQPADLCPQRHAGSTFESSNPSHQAQSSPTTDHTRDDAERARRCELAKSSETHLGWEFFFLFGVGPKHVGKDNGYGIRLTVLTISKSSLG